MTDIYILNGRGQESWRPGSQARVGAMCRSLVSRGGRRGELRGPGGAHGYAGGGSFECSHDQITRLYQVMRWSQRIEARGVPLDCSTRDERMPWISEHHGLEGHGFAFRAAAMYANWLQDLRLAQRAEGSIPNVAPSFWTFGGAWSGPSR